MTEENNNGSAPNAEQPRAVLTSTQPRNHTAPSKPQQDGDQSDQPSGKVRRAAKRRWLKPVVRRVRLLKSDRKEGDSQHDGKVGGLKIIHFGGLGEVGRNMSAIQYDNEIVLIDAGVRFPESDEMPGIDFIIPNVEYLADKKDMVK